MDFTELETGRAILAEAAAAGCPHPTMKFWVWLNRPEQHSKNEAMTEEYVQVKGARLRRRASKPPVWYHLIITSCPVPFAPPTRFGVDPFIADAKGEYVCPLGHTKGLNILSEVHAHREDYDGSDFASTAEGIGLRGDVIVAAPLLLFSPRLRQLLLDNGIKGWQSEVAYLV